MLTASPSAFPPSSSGPAREAPRIALPPEISLAPHISGTTAQAMPQAMVPAANRPQSLQQAPLTVPKPMQSQQPAMLLSCEWAPGDAFKIAGDPLDFSHGNNYPINVELKQ